MAILVGDLRKFIADQPGDRQIDIAIDGIGTNISLGTELGTDLIINIEVPKGFQLVKSDSAAAEQSG